MLLDFTPEPSPRNRSGGWMWIVLLAAAVALIAVLSERSHAPAGWDSDFDEALARARESDKVLLVAFHMDGCPPCAAMDRSVLSSKPVIRALKGFVPVRINADQELALANRYSVAVTPTYAVIDASGRLLARCEGYQPPEAFVQFLEHARANRPSPEAPTGHDDHHDSP